MTALVWWDLRRALPLAATLIVVAALAAVSDILVNRGAGDLPIAVAVTMALYCLAGIGAGLLTQPADSRQTRFLALWPLRRRDLWLVRLPLQYLLALATGLALLALAHWLVVWGGQRSWSPQMTINGETLPLLVLVMGLLVTVSSLWAQALPTGWALVAASGTSVLLIGMWNTLLAAWLIPHLGPWLRYGPGTPTAFAADVLCGWAPQVLALALAGGLLFSRLPLLEMRRRLGYLLLALPLATVVSAAVTLALLVDPLPLRPGPPQEVRLTADGRQVVFTALSRAVGGATVHALWAVDSATGRRRLLARHARLTQVAQGGNGVAFSVFNHNWQADAATGRRRLLSPSQQGLSDFLPTQRFVSPNGRQVVLGSPSTTWLTGRPETAVSGRFLGWAPDSQSVYLVAQRPVPAQSGGARLTVTQVQVPAGTQSTVVTATVHTGGSSTAEGPQLATRLSPDGRFLTMPLRRGRRGTELVAVVDTATGAKRTLETGGGGVLWAGAGQYLWLPGTERRGWQVLAPPAFATVATVAPWGPSAEGGRVFRSPAGDRVYVTSRSASLPQEQSRLWMCDAGGRDCRLLGPAPRFLYGVAADGGLVEWAQGRLVVRDVSSGGERVLLSLAGTAPAAKEAVQ